MSLSFFISKPFDDRPQGSNRVWLLATDGPAGRAALGDTIDPSKDRERAEIVGWARFEKEKEKVYRSAAEVEADSGEHLVGIASSSNSGPEDSSAYGWREGAIFGWRVIEAQRCGGGGGGGGEAAEEARRSSRPVPLVPGTRLRRSVYLLERAPEVE